MDELTCWEVRDCGKGPDSDNPCVAATFTLADGFLGGENGSRACFYIKGTRCHEDDEGMTIPEKLKAYCLDCEFYRLVNLREGVSSNIFYYLKHLNHRLKADDRLHELPTVQCDLFGITPE